MLIFDDTIQAKPHSKENDLICWHYAHTVGHSVKGINLLNCLYYANEVSLPVAFELVKKPLRFCDVCNGLNATKETLETIYQKRWKVEVFHKSVKSNTSMAKSPARTQSNHIFMSLYATARLESGSGLKLCSV